MFRNYFTFILFLSISIFPFFSQDGIPDIVDPNKLVNNFSKEMPDFLSAEEEELLEKKLDDFSLKTSNQIVVVIVDDLAGYEPWEFATELGEKWGVGQGKEDDGIVILIKPTGGKGERKYFIAVGKGLEGAIPDATCRKIEEEELLPGFKEGNYYGALDNTTNVLMSLAKGEYNSDKYNKQHENKGSYLKVIIIVLIIIIFFIARTRGGGGKGGFTMGSGGMFFGGFGGGSGGFGGGSSGGGFGGFGGGSFGGGGSGGSW